MIDIINRIRFRNQDMTTGNFFWKIILFALPALFTQVMQLLYVTIDLTSVHYGDSAESMGAIASNSALINLIVIVFAGTSLGANVLISETKGANNRDKAEKVLHTSILFSLITGVLVGVLGFFISDDLLVLMGTEEKYIEKASLYLKIYFGGLPFLMIYNYAAQILRGQGDSRSPFIALAVAGVLNVGFDLLFVFPLHMGVAGVALATIISEAVSAFISMFYLIKGKSNYVSFSFKKLRFDSDSLVELLRIGLPAGLQGFFFSLPNVFIQASLYTIDPGNVNLENGANASGNIEGYFYACCDAVAVSTMTFIAANVGAKKKDNIPKCILCGAIWGTIFCVLIAIVTLTLYRPLLSLFVSNEVSIQAGKERLFLVGLFYFLDFTMAFSAAVMRGLKHSVYPMITTLLTCTVLRIVLILTVFPLDYFHTVIWLYALFPITWVVATISNGIALIYYLPRDLKKIENSLKLEEPTLQNE